MTTKSALILSACFLACALFTPNALAQSKKKITIIEETTDEKGNTTTKKIVKEGEEANDLDINQMLGGKTKTKEKTINIRIEDNANNEKPKLMWYSQDGSEEQLIELPDDGIKEDNFINTPKRAYLGVIGEKTNENNGIKLTLVGDGTAAQKAGLKLNDVMLSIDNKNINSFDELVDIMATLKPEQKVVITYIRDGKTQNTEATLGQNQEEIRTYKIFKNDNRRMNDCNRICVEKCKPKAKLGVSIDTKDDNEGAVITEVREDGAAEAAGLQENDVIYKIDDQDIENTDDLIEVVSSHKPGDKIMIYYRRGGKKGKTEVTLKSDQKGNMGYEQNIESEEIIEQIILGDSNDEERQAPTMERQIRIQEIPNEGATPKTRIEERRIERRIERNGNNAPETPGTFVNEIEIINGQEEATELSIYPNPTNGVLTIKYKNADKSPLTISLLDAAGKEAFREDVNNFNGSYSKEISLKGNAEGTYFLNIKQGDKVTSEKVLFNK